jgi:cytochrome c biogenesis protein CcmG, thiol:disulfide interchange protein DsbE
MALTGALAGCSAGALKQASSNGNGGAQAPPFAARVLGGTRTVSLRSEIGHPVLLTSWATWCVDCRAELPAIERLSRQERERGLRVIGVNINAGSDTGPSRFVSDWHLTFPMLHDTDNSYQTAFNTVGVPESVLIDKRGRIVQVWPGALDVASALPLIRRVERE